MFAMLYHAVYLLILFHSNRQLSLGGPFRLVLPHWIGKGAFEPTVWVSPA